MPVTVIFLFVLDTACAAMANVLSNVIDNETVYTVTVDNVELRYAPFVNDGDLISGNRKKFFSLLPNPTPPLFGYFHYHAYLNRCSGKAWLGHAMLSTDYSDTDLGGLEHGQAPNLTKDSTFVLWEILVDRVDCSNVDGIVIELFLTDGENDGTVHLVKGLQKYLLDNKLYSTVELCSHSEFCHRLYTDFLENKGMVFTEDRGYPITTKNIWNKPPVTLLNADEFPSPTKNLANKFATPMKSARLIQQEQKAKEKVEKAETPRKKHNADKGQVTKLTKQYLFTIINVQK